WSEIVGLVPERALLDAGIRHVQLRGFNQDQLLERKIRSAVTPGPTLASFRDAVASATPTPGGGSVVALVGALAAALAQMVAGLPAGRPKYVAVDATMRAVAGEASTLGALLSTLVDRDAAAYSAVVAAYKLPKEPDAAAAARRAAIADATIGATMVPL